MAPTNQPCLILNYDFFRRDRGDSFRKIRFHTFGLLVKNHVFLPLESTEWTWIRSLSVAQDKIGFPQNVDDDAFSLCVNVLIGKQGCINGISVTLRAPFGLAEGNTQHLFSETSLPPTLEPVVEEAI